MESSYKTDDLQKQYQGLKDQVKDLSNQLGQPLELNDIPQGPSSRLDSDTVDGLQTSRAAHPSPNTLVPVDKAGKLGLNIMPGASGTFTTVDLKTVTVTNGIIVSIV